MSHYLTTHRAHDYKFLATRWRKVAKAARLDLTTLCEEANFPILALRPRKPLSTPAVYLSAGVHGDESGATLGLIEWAEANPDLLASGNFHILPCLNPWGLINNIRNDHQDEDLNRIFHSKKHPLVCAWRKWISDTRFAFTLCLHEDYDAQGTYLYELSRRAPWIGHQLLEAPSIPPDPRKSIDGRPAKNGLIQRRRAPNMKGQEPEPIPLYLRHTDLALTFETPSEFSLDLRAQAHRCAIETALKLCLHSGK